MRSGQTSWYVYDHDGLLDDSATTAYGHQLNSSFTPWGKYGRDLAAITQPFLLVAGLDDEAFITEQYEPAVSESASGYKISFKYCPVYDSATCATCSGVPSANRRPPAAPPSGPRSMTQSATLMGIFAYYRMVITDNYHQWE
jgi:hypothetical protein